MNLADFMTQNNQDKENIMSEYKKEKEDIFIKSNNLLKALANKKTLEKSKYKNRMAILGSGGTAEDMNNFIENSYQVQEDEVIREKNQEIRELNESYKNKKSNSKNQSLFDTLSYIFLKMQGLG